MSWAPRAAWLLRPESPRWQAVAPKVAGAMVSVNPIHVSEWLPIFRPVKDQLRAALLKQSCATRTGDETNRVHAMNILVDYASDNPSELVDLLQEARTPRNSPWFSRRSRRRREQIAPVARTRDPRG